MYVYKNTKEGLFTVGFYEPGGRFVPESDHFEERDAAGRVHYLNGGVDAELIGQVFNHVCGLLVEPNNSIVDVMMEKSHGKN